MNVRRQWKPLMADLEALRQTTMMLAAQGLMASCEPFTVPQEVVMANRLAVKMIGGDELYEFIQRSLQSIKDASDLTADPPVGNTE